MLAITYVLNDVSQVYPALGFLHLNIVSQIIVGGIPPGNPVLAGEFLRYTLERGHNLYSLFRGQLEDDREHRIDLLDPQGNWANWTTTMHYECIPRHGNGINVAFADGHVEYVSLRGLWKLLGHKGYDVTASNSIVWPSWMD